ncbi:MAG: hypothetical protein EA364_09185 [Balneolaceae bacterium]|nr:MAG: hypothetical protein EA364_09185 [Balneolaceae bacterium]
MGRTSRKSGSGTWLITYSDLVTLLMVFFIVLYTLTPGIEERKFNMILKTFQGGNKVLDAESIMPAETFIIESRRVQKWDSVRRYIEFNMVEDRMEVEMLPDGIKIVLSDDLTFDSGSSRLLNEAKKILSDLSHVFKNDVLAVEIDGHTDNRPLLPGAQYKTNWQLGASRATSVLEYLLSVSTLDAGAFRATTYSEYRPRSDNKTEEGRRSNRRVEIFLKIDENPVFPYRAGYPMIK